MKYVMLYHNNINCSSLYWCWWAEAPHCIDTVRASAPNTMQTGTINIVVIQHYIFLSQ